MTYTPGQKATCGSYARTYGEETLLEETPFFILIELNIKTKDVLICQKNIYQVIPELTSKVV